LVIKARKTPGSSIPYFSRFIPKITGFIETVSISRNQGAFLMQAPIKIAHMATKKPHLNLMDTVICRTPAFGIDDNQKTRWQQLKELVKESSPEFYKVIAEQDLEQLYISNNKAAFSVWKYFNRACFRSTPFGNFAAISFALIDKSGDNTRPLQIQSRITSHRFIDWSAKEDHQLNARKMVQASQWFQSNLTYYIIGEQLRYIRNIDGQFELATVVIFDELNKLLVACRTRQNKDAIYTLMHSVFSMQPCAVDNLLCQLIECQLLLTELIPNITGEDYFKRLQLPETTQKQQYIIAERQANGLFNAEPLDIIPEYLEFIKNFIPQTENGHLEKFRQEFSKKFDLKAVPLSIALDPETGIGYGDMAQCPYEPELNTIFSNIHYKKVHTTSPFNYTAQHRFLLNALIKGNTIRLETYENEDDKNPAQLPNTLSVMFHYWQNMPVLQTAGCCTANSLLGRFTLGCKNAENLTKQIVEIEESANPDVLFFDIAYQAEKRVDNVNRRKQVYNYELPILTWSSTGSTLSVDDILVLIRDSEIMLWSKRYNKRIVPRFATAYNYNRSDLAVYRFLCDLQHQHIKSDLTFNLQQLFPGLDRYPRVTYKNIIISAATWRIDQNIFASRDKEINLIILQNWLRSNNINTYFKCGNSDQTLCFNPQNPQDMHAFLTYCSQNNKKDIYIQEALIDETSIIKDEQGKKYLPQYIANYFHQQQIYHGLRSDIHQMEAANASADTYLPGSEWLFFEIYCHPARANDVLSQYISEIINNQKKHLQKWFFIRYSDPKPHIRLRLKVKNAGSLSQIVHAVKTSLESLWHEGLIADIQLKTYFRETERYGRNRIDLAEEFFCYDSKYVLRLLSANYSARQLYQLTLKMMHRLYALSFTNANERISLIKAVANKFSNEFLLDNADYKAINQSYENFRINKKNWSLRASETLLNQYESTFYKLINACNTPNEIANMVADMVHMHINRVFYTDQRMHEAILYQYLLKQAKAQQHLSTAEAVL
jgi:thiopeptide-type bacteriocin biosynthesis protein